MFLQYHKLDKVSRRGSFKPQADERKTFMCTLCNAVVFGLTAYKQHSALHMEVSGCIIDLLYMVIFKRYKKVEKY